MSLSVRDRVHEIATAIVGGEPSPADLRSYELQLSGLLALTNKHAAACEVAYKRKLAHERVEHKTSAEAKMVAEASDEYADLVDANLTAKSLIETIRTIRRVSRSLDEEMRLQR